jgi:hypothetical protein
MDSFLQKMNKRTVAGVQAADAVQNLSTLNIENLFGF